MLVGTRADADTFARAVDAELAAAEPLADNAFKVPLARGVAVRLLTALAEPPQPAANRPSGA